MVRLFVMGLVVLTSWTAYTVGVKQPGRKEKSLRHAFATVLECLGTFSVFLAINTGLGALIIVLVRSITPQFVSLYVVGDVMLVMLSFFQGFMFQLWWRQ